MMKRFTLIAASAFMIASCAADTAAKPGDKQTEAKPAAETPVKKAISAEPLRSGLYRLTGPGGNIGVLVGSDGAFIIDDKFDRFGDEIIAVVKTLTNEPISYVINTHYHGDHTGANGKMKSAGAIIVAHENVRARMGITFDNKLWGRPVEATAPAQWPTVTYSENATFHINGQTVELLHTPSAHTDGDSIVFFKEANVLHMGDNYFNGMFPYVDIDSGGSLQGMIASHDLALSLINDDTLIIPGHGNMSNKSELIATRDRLKDILSRIETAHNAGKSLDDIIMDKPLSDLKAFAAFINEDMMVRIAHRSVTEKN